MGNTMTSYCCITSDQQSSVTIIHWEGTTRTLTGRKKWLAGELMFEFPDSMICNADSFFIGHPVPSLSIDEHLKPGQTYFVLPLDIFSSKTLSASSVSALLASMSPKRAHINFKECPFEYLKGSNGRVLIKVSPEFITRIITRRGGGGDDDQENAVSGFLCSTPELKKQYEQLVGSKDQTWSPRLETISEHNKIRYSPYRLIGLEPKEKEYN